MALQLGALRDALIDAGADAEKANKAAQELPATSASSLTSSQSCASLNGPRPLRWPVSSHA
jgi:hypothetical protein